MALDPSSQNLNEFPSQDRAATSKVYVSIIKVNKLIGLTFLRPSNASGPRFCVRILCAIDNHGQILRRLRMQFICSITDDEKEEILSYNKRINYILVDTSGEAVICKLKITANQGPLTQNDEE